MRDTDVQGWFVGLGRTLDCRRALLLAITTTGVRGRIRRQEIGEFHGKSFIHMALHLDLQAGVLEPAVALDVFAEQEEPRWRWVWQPAHFH